MSHLHNILKRKIPVVRELLVGPAGSVFFPARHNLLDHAPLEFVFINITILSVTLPGTAAFHILLVIIIPILKTCLSDSEWSSQDHMAVTSENQV